MKNTAEEKRLRRLLIALGGLSAGCAIVTAVAALLGRENRLLIAAALAASMIVNAIAVTLSRMQREA